MPIYLNSSSERVVIGGRAVEPGVRVETLGFVDEATLGVTKIQNLPAYNPVLLAEKVTTAKTIAIPVGLTRFAIHMYVKTGEPTINFSDAANTPALLLYPTARWNLRYYERMIDSLIIGGTGIELWVIIEQI